MPDLTDGERVTVQGSGANQYTLARDRAVYSCSCPAWRNMRLPIVERRCKHLVAYLGDTALPPPRARLAPARGSYPMIRRAVLSTYDEPREERSVREAALAEAIDAHVVLFDKMEEVYNLRLPKEIAYAAGFYLGLTEEEKTILAGTVTRGLIGIGAWFLPGGLDWSGDQRLRDRAADDPPEVVPVMAGFEDHDRYALLYDEPSELPVGIVRRHEGRTTLCSASLLETLRERVVLAAPHPLEESRRWSAILAWLDEVLRRVEGNEEPSALTFQSLGWARGSFTNPYVPGWSVPEDLVGAREHADRHAAYAAGAPEVETWIARARVELAEGSPGRALFLGRELHMSGSSAVRARASELLIRAYAVLGRTALLEIVRAQHLALHASIDLYELPPAHGIVLAASSADASAIAQAWDKDPPTENDVEEALKRAANAEVFDAIFDRIDVDTRERATRVALGRRLTQMLRLPAGSKDREALGRLIGRILTRSSIDARAFQRLLEARNEELALGAAESVDVTSTSQGETALHIAARQALPALVEILLARGADARAKNARGRMAFDDASLAQVTSPREAHQILLMLEAAGGGVGKVPTLSYASDGPTWSVGDKVQHAKFGEGVVERVESGADVKLQIRFGKKDVKVLLAKFIARR